MCRALILSCSFFAVATADELRAEIPEPVHSLFRSCWQTQNTYVGATAALQQEGWLPVEGDSRAAAITVVAEAAALGNLRGDGVAYLRAVGGAINWYSAQVRRRTAEGDGFAGLFARQNPASVFVWPGPEIAAVVVFGSQAHQSDGHVRCSFSMQAPGYESWMFLLTVPGASTQHRGYFEFGAITLDTLNIHVEPNAQQPALTRGSIHGYFADSAILADTSDRGPRSNVHLSLSAPFSSE